MNKDWDSATEFVLKVSRDGAKQRVYSELQLGMFGDRDGETRGDCVRSGGWRRNKK